MTKSSINANSFDSYKGFNFCVTWNDHVVAGFSDVSGIDHPIDTATYREGEPSTSSNSPGRSKFDAITLRRGITHDPEFGRWVTKAGSRGFSPGAKASAKDLRKDLVIEIYNESGRLVRAYKASRCWVSEFQALPEFDAKTSAAVAIQSMKLEHEGWVRDKGVAEPGET